MRIPIYVKLVLFIISLIGFMPSVNAGDNLAELKERFRRPGVITFPDNAPYSPQMATLGKMLFFDPRVSGAQNMSCASCHNPSFGWETPVEKAIGAMNISLDRHAPTILNLSEASQLFWDGRAQSLEEQAAGPITHPKEMNAKFPELISRLNSIEEYKYWFNQLFPTKGVTKNNILTAIATFERTVESGWAPFDDWVDGNEDAISASAKRGFSLFTGKGQCSNCHTGWNFTDHSMHDIGLETNDLGASIITKDANLTYAFKTPGLRNITLRAPYMHNGSLAKITDVIQHYKTGGLERPSKSAFLQEVNLDEKDVADLKSFLSTLTEPNPNVETPALPAR